MTEKVKKYDLLLRQAKSLAEGETDDIALMANLSAIIHEAFHFWWTGFYRVIGEELVLGPFQGPLACTRIARGRGVCGTAWQERRTLVVPVFRNGEIIAVLDIDSEFLSTFDDVDREWLERIVECFL